MTMILAMLILIYKRINGFGFKTAKRRFALEFQGYNYRYDSRILRR